MMAQQEYYYGVGKYKGDLKVFGPYYTEKEAKAFADDTLKIRCKVISSPTLNVARALGKAMQMEDDGSLELEGAE